MFNYNLEIHDTQSKNHIPFLNLEYAATMDIIKALETQKYININVEILSTNEKMTAKEFLKGKNIDDK